MSLDLTFKEGENNLWLVKPSRRIIYEFEGFRLDAEHLMLYRDEREVSLTPKQVETLLALIEQPGEIVSKDVLMWRLWGQTSVEESNLIQNIHYLRRALGETSDGRQMIETLRRRGYRFNGKLSDQAEKPDVGQPEQQLVSNGKRHVVSPDAVDVLTSSEMFKGSRGRLLASGVLALVTVTAVIGFLILRPAQSAVQKQQFAVLPLRPIDAINRNDLYEIGVADEMINRLSLVQGLTVRPLSSVREYGPDKDPLEAGREQRVDYVLESSYQIADGKIKINSRLINVATGETENTFPFKTDAQGAFAVQDAVATDLVNKLVVRLGASSSGAEKKRGTENEEAYLSYIQGCLLLDRGNKLKNGNPEAVEYFDRAVALDPNYARAWAAKALVHNYAALKETGSEQYRYAVESINKALSIDPGQSDAYAALCHEKLFYEWDYPGAESACRKAIDLDPSSSLAHMEYAVLLSSRGRWDENFVQLKTAMELNPASYRVQWYYGNSLYFSRRYDEAVAQYKKVIDLMPDRDITYEDLIKALEQQGNTAEAFEWFIKLLVQRHDDRLVQRFRTVYQGSGYRGVLQEKSVTSLTDRPVQSVTLLAQLGEKDKAFQILEDRYASHKWGMAVTFPVEPQLDPLRDDPRYADLIKRIERR